MIDILNEISDYKYIIPEKFLNIKIKCDEPKTTLTLEDILEGEISRERK